MPAKKLPQIHLMVKTHKYTLALTLFPTQTIRDLKDQVITALQQFSDPSSDPEAGFPLAPKPGDFEVMRRNQDVYELLEEGERAMDLKLMAWDRLFLAWRDRKGKLMPVHIDKFSFWGDDEDEQMDAPAAAPKAVVPKANGSVAKGKRKMEEDDFEPDIVDDEDGDMDI